MKILQIHMRESNSISFITDNIQSIIIVVAILVISAFILTIIKSVNQGEKTESIVANWEKEKKNIFKGTINLIGGGNFLNVKGFSIKGFFYEMEDRFISTDGKAYYKNAIESTDLNKIYISKTMKIFKRKPSLLDDAKEEISILRIKNENLSSDLRKKYKSLQFMKNYCNEDWNRDTPFSDKIDTENIIFKYYELDELDNLVGSKLFDLSDKEYLENSFKEYYDLILELSVAKFLFLIADLKSYQKSSNKRTPTEYFEWRFNFHNKKLF